MSAENRNTIASNGLVWLPEEPRRDHVRDRRRGTVLVVILRSLLFPALGAVAAYWLIDSLYLPRVGLGTVERIAEIGRHLDRPFSQNVIAVLGNSIIMEGIDASVVQSALGTNSVVQNLATEGAGPTEFQISLPRLLKARPRIVVMGLQPQDIGALADLPSDKAFAYAFGDFVEDWPPDWSKADLPGLTDSAYSALTSSRARQVLHFRRAPLNALNDAVRLRLRSGLRGIEKDDWQSPFQLLASLDDYRLSVHLGQVKDMIAHRLEGGDRGGSSEIKRIAAFVEDSEATPIFVILPVHPELKTFTHSAKQDLYRLLSDLSSSGRTRFFDASTLLSADEFADALHPNASGRRKFSTFLGQQLATK